MTGYEAYQYNGDCGHHFVPVLLDHEVETSSAFWCKDCRKWTKATLVP